jgi:hypothetical protein
MGEISKARCRGARMCATPSVDRCDSGSPSKRDRSSLRSSCSSGERLCLSQSKLRRSKWFTTYVRARASKLSGKSGHTSLRKRSSFIHAMCMAA